MLDVSDGGRLMSFFVVDCRWVRWVGFSRVESACCRGRLVGWWCGLVWWVLWDRDTCVVPELGYVSYGLFG
jgi:hypothetical protein